MKPLTPMHLSALGYVANTRGTATVAQFDDDHDPTGPDLRRILMPGFMIERENGKLCMTGAGIAAIIEAERCKDAAGLYLNPSEEQIKGSALPPAGGR